MNLTKVFLNFYKHDNYLFVLTSHVFDMYYLKPYLSLNQITVHIIILINYLFIGK